MKSKLAILIVISASALISCTGTGNKEPSEKEKALPSVKASPHKKPTGSICFLHTEGNQNQDTSFLHLNFRNGDVSGDFYYIPYEKDRREGTFTGILKGDTISGKWVFMQEGMKDSLEASFLLGENSLRQKAYSVNKSTGREYLADTSGFTIKYIVADCSMLPGRRSAKDRHP